MDFRQFLEGEVRYSSLKLTFPDRARELFDRAEKEAKAGRTCPNCGHENPEGTRFCQECGGKLGGAKCPSCGADNGPGVKFCQQCGSRMEAAASAVCPSCGEQNPPGTRFCGGCGGRLEG